MGNADIGNDPDAGPGRPGQDGDFPRMGHPHFNDGVFVAGIQPEQGFGKPDVIIQIPQGFEGFPLHLQHRADHILGGGFAHAAGDPHHKGVEQPPVIPGKLRQRLPGGLHHQHRRPGIHRFFAYYRRRPGFYGLGDKVMSVEPLALQGHKDAARNHLGSVGHNIGNRAVGGAFRAHRPGNLPQLHILQRKVLLFILCFMKRLV